MTSLSKDFRKLPIFAGTYLVNVFKQQYLLLFVMMPKTRPGVRLEKLSDAAIKATRGTVIHRAFQMRPLSKDRLWTLSLVEPVSDWAPSKMIDELHRRGVNAAYKFHCAIRGSPDSSTLRGNFEICLHRFLKTSRSFTINSLDNHSAIKIRFTSEHLIFEDMKCFSGHLASPTVSHISVLRLFPVPTLNFAISLVTSHRFAG